MDQVSPKAQAERDRPRFTLVLTLQDRFGEPISMAVDLDDKCIRVSSRAVQDMKMEGELSRDARQRGVSPFPSSFTFNDVVHMIKTREFRKKLFIEAARRLGASLAERMEDAEGWHDESRIEPARAALGGRWDR